MEINEMYEKAKGLSSLFNENNSNTENSQNDIDEEAQMKQFMKMANLMKMINASQGNKPEQGNQENQENNMSMAYKSMVYEDEQTPALRAISAAIPYLDIEYQKNIGIIVKIIEIDNLIKKYKNASIHTQSNKSKNWQKDMLLAMKSELDSHKQHLIDMFIKIMDISEISKLMKEETSNNG